MGIDIVHRRAHAEVKVNEPGRGGEMGDGNGCSPSHPRAVYILTGEALSPSGGLQAEFATYSTDILRQLVVKEGSKGKWPTARY